MSARPGSLGSAAIGALIAILVAACGEPTSGSLSAPTPEGDAPPAVRVRFFDQSMDLVPYTYCYGDTCIDGIPPADLSDVGEPQEILVEFPLPDWSFTALFTPAGEECGRVQEVPLEARDDRTFDLRPAGYADTYDVTLFGRGQGSLFVTFRWTTPTDGPLPTPEARLAVLSDANGPVRSHGVELEVSNLASTPAQASATITVRAASGEAITFEATRARDRCRAEGTVYWDGPDTKGRAAAALGDPPFAYDVEVVLDGVTYAASATWPEDEIVGNEPSVALEFTPDLPALS